MSAFGMSIPVIVNPSPLLLWGDASDGVINFDGTTTRLGLVPSSGTYTLTRDIYLDTGSQTSGTAKINTGGYRIFCRGTFTNGASCEIHRNGNAASGATLGAALAVGTLGDSGAGTTGATGVANGASASNVTNSIASPTEDPATNRVGGKGGAITAGTGNGVNANAGAAGTINSGSPRQLFGIWSAFRSTTAFRGGAGGNGGDAAAGALAGGGGGGGGVVEIDAMLLVNLGSINAKGGAGANAVTAGSGAGGGGGGGGGAIILVYGAGSTVGTTSVVGAAGGTGLGGGGTGGTAQDGTVYSNQV